MDVVTLVGRILLAAMFLLSGINHLTKIGAMTGYAQFKKVPAPKASVVLSGILLALGGLSVILGAWADLGAVVLAAMSIVMALKMHAFWGETDPQAKQMEMIALLKNFSMAGGLLFVFATYASAEEGVKLAYSLT
ncbi:MAG: DoxX family protein, partial [Acidobacteria bacterium]|nr:DoxX family protein [Acidobacteriota bacterium]